MKDGFCPVGVIDPYGELKEGQIYCALRADNFSKSGDNKIKWRAGVNEVFVLGSKHPKVVVSKMPCVHPGDV